MSVTCGNKVSVVRVCDSKCRRGYHAHESADWQRIRNLYCCSADVSGGVHSTAVCLGKPCCVLWLVFSSSGPEM